MMYASTAICAFDPTCPGLFESDTNRINLPLAFNVSVCPFCGEQSRDEAPSLFYAPHRNLVIYVYPRLGQYSEEEARQVHRPVVQALRDRLIARLSRDECGALRSRCRGSHLQRREFSPRCPDGCPASAPMRQNGQVEEGRISGPS